MSNTTAILLTLTLVMFGLPFLAFIFFGGHLYVRARRKALR